MAIARTLEHVIIDSYRDATICHGTIGLTLAAWRSRVLAILRRCKKDPDDDASARFAAQLHNNDLYLATCCADGADTAWRRFEALYRKYIRELVQCIARNEMQALDLGEDLLVDLFLPDRSGQSRIGSYDGRSSLATWLHVIVTHRVANERVRKWNTVERPGDVPEVADVAWIGSMDADLRAARYGPAIEASLREACRGLTPREGQLLIWRYQGGLMLEEIARLISVHPSTVCRQLERLQVRLRNEVIAILASSYGYPAAVIDECVDDVLENRSRSVSLFGLMGESLPRQDGALDPSVVQRHIA